MLRINDLADELLREIYRAGGIKEGRHGINPYPGEVVIRQNEDLNHYVRMLRCTRFGFPSLIPADSLQDHLDWQVRQIYRIVNSMLASTSRTIKPLIPYLKKLRDDLERCPPIENLLTDIISGKVVSDIYCSGHGSWKTEDGTVTFRNQSQSVLFYTPFDAYLLNSLAWQIESNRFDPNSLCIINKDAKDRITLTYPAATFPQAFNHHTASIQPVPNFKLTSDDKLPACLIEGKTGRIFKLDKPTSLQRVMNSYPGSTIHWVACTPIKDEAAKKIKPSRSAYTHTTFARKRYPNKFVEPELNVREHKRAKTA